MRPIYHHECDVVQSHAVRWGWSLIALTILSTSMAQAQTDCRDLACAYNPQPKSDDFLLPMPGNFKMAFRKVLIPGGPEFWGSPQRLAKVGDIQGAGGAQAIFEGVQRLPVAGSFTDGNAWFYYLGKYEVTVGQYLAVMGNGDLKEGIKALKERGDDAELIRKLDAGLSASNPAFKDLAQPLRTLGWYDYQDFMHRYNLWCYDTPACREALPCLPQRLAPGQPKSDTPGFFRLPTDLEWEYAARGGMAMLGQPAFENTLPFDAAKAKDYVWAKTLSQGKGPTRIGRLPPVHGFYDLFGNVQELTADYFRADLIQGKVGGLSARGGSYLDYDPTLRVSQRAELPLYQIRGGKLAAARSPTTGIRLAIGSQVVESERYREDLVAQYQDYLTGFRKTTPAGGSTADPFTQVADVSLREAQELLASIATAHPGDQTLQNRVAKVRQHLQTADKQLDEGVTDVVDKLTRNALVLLKTAGYNTRRALETTKAIETLASAATVSGRTSLVTNAQRKYEIEKDAADSNFAHYAETVERLQGYPREKVVAAVDVFDREQRGDRPYSESCKLLRRHLAAPVNRTLWRQQLYAMATTPGVYQ